MRASVVIVGDEILSGHVRDANGPFIARRLAELGHDLRTIAVVPDDLAVIAETVRREVAVSQIVFVCGGVGPTHDDRTMEGVALALGEPLEVCEPVAERIVGIAEHLRAEGFTGDPLGIAGLRKMALVPRGAQVLPSAVGLIPALALRVREHDVVVLPGPPRELETVFRDAVEPRYLAGTGTVAHREEITHPFPESSIAADLARLESDYPEVRIGSYPQEGHSLVRITGPAPDVSAAAARLREILAQLEASPEGRRLLDFMRRRREGRA